MLQQKMIPNEHKITFSHDSVKHYIHHYYRTKSRMQYMGGIRTPIYTLQCHRFMLCLADIHAAKSYLPLPDEIDVSDLALKGIRLTLKYTYRNYADGLMMCCKCRSPSLSDVAW